MIHMLTTVLINAQIDKLRTLYARKWNDAQLDCLICPASPSVASVHGETLHWGYSCVWNVLDYPAVVLPLGLIQLKDTWQQGSRKGNSSFGPLDDWYAEQYDLLRYKGAPLSVQIVGRRLQEEKVLMMASHIEKAFRMEQEPPEVVAVDTDEHLHVAEEIVSREEHLRSAL
jgi:amidase